MKGCQPSPVYRSRNFGGSTYVIAIHWRTASFPYPKHPTAQIRGSDGVECFVKVFFGDRAEWDIISTASIGEDDIQATLLSIDRGVKTIEVCQI
jgi:hypothetical protein